MEKGGSGGSNAGLKSVFGYVDSEIWMAEWMKACMHECMYLVINPGNENERVDNIIILSFGMNKMKWNLL